MTQLIRGLPNLFRAAQNPQFAAKGSVVTIGNFDGVHLGHQALLTALTSEARRLGVPSLVIVFEPQPFEFFAREKAAARLTRWREKFSLLASYGVDVVLVVRFNEQFADLSAEDFVQQILIDALAARAVIIGDDFHFGRNRQGDFAFLQARGNAAGFSVTPTKTIMLNDERISSTLVRRALADADHERVKQLLGRAYTMQGKVVYGHQRGRILGFPTANIFLHRAVTPVQGVYAVRMHGIGKKALPGVANVGVRPTVGGTRTILEVHLFDFNEEIYGRHVSVEFCAKLRDEKRFDNLDLLKAQILQDAALAKHYFEMRGETI